MTVDHHPRTTDELDSRHLALLWGFRAIAIGRSECPLVRCLLAQLCGARADVALANMIVFVRLVGWKGARRIRLHLPGCSAVSDDERLILSVVSAAEAAILTGDVSSLTERLSQLLGGVSDASITAAATSFAREIAVRARRLERRPGASSAAQPMMH